MKKKLSLIMAIILIASTLLQQYVHSSGERTLRLPLKLLILARRR